MKSDNVLREIISSEEVHLSTLKSLTDYNQQKELISIANISGTEMSAQDHMVFEQMLFLMAESAHQNELVLADFKRLKTAYQNQEDCSEILNSINFRLRNLSEITANYNYYFTIYLSAQISSRLPTKDIERFCDFDPQNNFYNVPITPVQRMPRYEMLFRELVKYTPEDHPAHANLVQTQSYIKDLVNYVDGRKAQYETDAEKAAVVDTLKHKTDISGFEMDVDSKFRKNLSKALSSVLKDSRINQNLKALGLKSKKNKRFGLFSANKIKFTKNGEKMFEIKLGRHALDIHFTPEFRKQPLKYQTDVYANIMLILNSAESKLSLDKSLDKDCIRSKKKGDISKHMSLFSNLNLYLDAEPSQDSETVADEAIQVQSDNPKSLAQMKGKDLLASTKSLHHHTCYNLLAELGLSSKDVRRQSAALGA